MLFQATTFVVISYSIIRKPIYYLNQVIKISIMNNGANQNCTLPDRMQYTEFLL